MPYSSRPSLTVTAGEVCRNFGLWQDRAADAPVVVTHHGRPRVVMVGAEHYRLGEAAGSAAPTESAALALLMGHMAEGFFTLDADLRFTTVNPVFEDYVAKSAAQLVGQLWVEVFPSLRDSLLYEHYRRTLRTGETAEFEVASTIYPGRVVGVKVFPFAKGVGVLFVNRTVERDQERLLEDAAALRALTEAIPGLSRIDANLRGRLVSVDDQFLELTGFDRDSLLRYRLSDIIRPRDRASLTTAIDAVLEGEGAQSLVTGLLRHNGEDAPVQITLAALDRAGRPDGLKGAVLSLG